MQEVIEKEMTLTEAEAKKLIRELEAENTTLREKLKHSEDSNDTWSFLEDDRFILYFEGDQYIAQYSDSYGIISVNNKEARVALFELVDELELMGKVG